jgi:hypothetical protein
MTGRDSSVIPAPAKRGSTRWRLAPAAFLGGVMLLGLLALANFIGRTVVEPDVAVVSPKAGRELVVIQTSQTGWPLPFVAVNGQRPFPLVAMEGGVHWISWPALALDLMLGLAFVVGGAWLFAMWVKGRRRLLQFGLLDLLLVISAVGLGLGYGYLPRLAHLEDQRTIEDVVGNQAPFNHKPSYFERRIVWQPGRMEWLRQLAGERWLPDTGRVVAANVWGNDVRRLAKLDRLRVVRLYGSVTDRELNQLGQLRELECLDLCNARIHKDRGGWIDSPDASVETPLALPQLKRLYATNSVLQGSDLAGCPSLVELELTGTEMDLPSARTLRRLTSLKILDLRGTALDDAMLAELNGLSNLEMIDLSHTQVTDAGVVHLVKLPNLRSVWLAKTAVSDAGRARLAAARPDCTIHP